MSKAYIIAAAGEWNEKFNDYEYFVSNPSELNSILKSVSPKYIFFIHWHWKIPNLIWSNFECIAFHMTNLPYGRGGSPLQNLILKGHKETKLTAFLVEEGFDSGPIYLKKDLDLQGSAHDIYKRTSSLSVEMMDEIISKNIKPKRQEGQVVKFKRRKPNESLLPSLSNLKEMYDFIRMLDAPGYPKAFSETAKIRIEFDQANYAEGKLTTRLKILKK